MAESETRTKRAPRRSWTIAEKRRIVELTLAPGVSARAIAREHDVHHTGLCQWIARYRAGTLGGPPAERARLSEPGPRFVPVSLTAATNTTAKARPPAAAQRANGGLELTFPSGIALRIEDQTIDATLVCAVVAELRR